MATRNIFTFLGLDQLLMKGMLGLNIPAVNAPAVDSFVVTKSDTVDLPFAIRALTIAVGGTVSYIGIDGETNTTEYLPSGTYSFLATRILSTGTSASQMTGWV